MLKSIRPIDCMPVGSVEPHVLGVACAYQIIPDIFISAPYQIFNCLNFELLNSALAN